MNGDFWRWILFMFALGVVLGAAPAGSLAEPLPPEVEAIRAERERQRAALDRIRRKVEALQEAEERRTPAEREQEDRLRAARQLLRETAAPAPDPAREREIQLRRAAEQEQERQAQEAAREEVARQEQEARAQEEARRLEAKRERERLAAKRHAEQNQTLFFALAMLFGALCFLPFVALYRDFIEAYWKSSERTGSSIAFALSGGCLLVALWMSDTVSFAAIPDAFLLLGFLGLYFWFFVPGLVAQFLIFLHSLFVPHPLEIAFQRVLRGETISRAEAADITDAIRRFYQNGSPADWRVKSALARLERLAKLMGRENAFVDFLSESILHQHERPESGRRSPP